MHLSGLFSEQSPENYAQDGAPPVSRGRSVELRARKYNKYAIFQV